MSGAVSDQREVAACWGCCPPLLVWMDSSLAMPLPGLNSWPQLAKGRLVSEKSQSPGLAVGPRSDTGTGTAKARAQRLLWTFISDAA